ncbi:MAG: hypothetical protein PVF54_10250 [Anaerolineae bacterium]|jgi:tRNA A58 N-methylase Trm61
MLNNSLTTQSLKAEDAACLLMKLDVGPDCRVVRAGTNSASLTPVLAQGLKPAGRLTPHRDNSRARQMARQRWDRLGLTKHVEFKGRRLVDGFDGRGADAQFLSIANPSPYPSQTHAAPAGAGLLESAALPGIQITNLVAAPEGSPCDQIEVEGSLLREYGAIPAALRLEDRMKSHTGSFTPARSHILSEDWRLGKPTTPCD